MIMMPSSESMTYLKDLREIVQSLDELKAEIENKKIFITGGTGFLGRWLVDGLLALGAKVTVLTRNREKALEINPYWKSNPNISLIEGNLSGRLHVEMAFDEVIHAANDLSFSAEAALEAAKVIFDLSKESGAKRVLFLSSGAVYHIDPKTSSPYATAKQLIEKEGVERATHGDFEFKIARCFAFLGPHQDLQSHFAATQFFNDVIHGRAITIQGDGSPIRSFLYPTDFAIGVLKILFQGRSQQAYDLGSSEAVTIADLAKLISNGGEVNILKQVSKSLSQSNSYLPNLSLIEKELKFHQTVNLREAITRTKKFYLETFPNSKSLA